MRIKILYLLPIFVLTFFIIGCVTTNAGNKEKWRSLNSTGELIGRWEGTTSTIIPENKENNIPQSYINMFITLEYKKDADNLDIIYKMDLDKMITDMLKTDAMKQAGIAKDHLWGLLLDAIQNTDEAGVITDYGKYYLIITEKPEIDNLSNCYINEKGSLIRIVFEDVLFFGLGDAGITDVILTKK